jgi:dsDNA-binding SOS-regulon protein
MTVEIRYHVIRNGKEVAMYTTKKEADEHDKMLDIAERLADFIVAADSFDVEESVLEELTLYLARNRMAMIQILKGTKPKKAAAPKSEEAVESAKTAGEKKPKSRKR